MVNSNWTYIITYYNKDDSWNITDITGDVGEIPLFTDTSDREANTAILILNAKKGQFIKNNINGKPKIKNLDRIRISATDGSGGIYGKVFDVIRMIPMKSKHDGTKLKLSLVGVERWLQKINYAKTHYNATASDVLIDIVDFYNRQRGTLMPTLSIGTNELPKSGTLKIDFGLNEDSCYNRIFDLTGMMASPGTSGGAFDFFDVKFVTHQTTIQINVFSSGNKTDGKPSVTINSSNINMGESDSGLDAIEATLINAWGDNNSGSLPIEFSKFKSRQLLMPTESGSDSAFPKYDTSGNTTYKSGSIVQYNNSIWQAVTDTNATPPTFWTNLTTTAYYGGIVYSPWTKGKALYWKNSMADPLITNYPFGDGTPRVRAWDINIIINDLNSLMWPVDLVSTTDTLNAFWLYDGTQSGKYDGLTVLVTNPGTTNAGTGGFTGKTHKIVMYNNGEWITKVDPVTNLLCCSLNTGKVFRFNGTIWQDKTIDVGGSWCFHPIEEIVNEDSVFKNKLTGLDYAANANSAIKVKTTFIPLQANVQAFVTDVLPVMNWVNPSTYYQAGAWLNLRFPFPINTYGTTASKLGEIYGGSTSELKVPVLDVSNMNLTHDGKRGFNQGESSEDLGPISSIDFWTKIKFTNTFSNTVEATGDFKMRCALMDTSNHVVYQDFIIPFNDNWHSVKLPLSGFQMYRGRRPKVSGAWLFNILFPPKQLFTEEQFEWRNVKSMVIQTQESYDEYGRYAASGYHGFVQEVNYSLELYLDALRFTKPLLKNSGKVTDLVIEGDFLQKTGIDNYELLSYDVQAELERAKFPNKQYDIETTGKFDISYGDFFNFEDSEIVEDAADRNDGQSTVNRIKLVANHIEYSMTKPIDNKGGFLRRIRGARRFV